MNATRGDPSARFPRMFHAFAIHDAYLYEPLSGHLTPGSDVRFRLRVPGASKVNVVVGDTWQPLEQQGDTCTATLHITSGPLFIVPEFESDGPRHKALLQYEVP